MTVNVQIDELTDKKAIVAIYLDSKPVFWHASVQYQELKSDPTKQMKIVIYQPLIYQVINKFTDVEVSAQNNEELEHGLIELRRKFGSDIKALIRVHYMTEAIAESLLEGYYTDNSLNDTLNKFM